MSFANTVGVGGANYGGQYGTCSLSAVNDYYASATGGAWPGWGGIGGAGTHNYSVTIPMLTLSGTMVLQPDTTVNLYVKGNVYIQDKITYGSYTLGHAPRFNLYVKGNVYIDPNVSELHGVYVAQTGAANTGSIDTCAKVIGGAVVTTQSYGNCKAPLAVIGSVAAQGKLQLTRTIGNIVPVPAFGGQPAVPNVPSETFRYSPELWVSAPGNTTLDTQAYTSLPPVL